MCAWRMPWASRSNAPGRAEPEVVEPGSAERHPLPRYSASMDAAMELVEILRWAGRWCCIELYSDQHALLWELLVTSEDVQGHENLGLTRHQYESLPEAICVAFLVARGVAPELAGPGAPEQPIGLRRPET